MKEATPTMQHYSTREFRKIAAEELFSCAW